VLALKSKRRVHIRAGSAASTRSNYRRHIQNGGPALVPNACSYDGCIGEDLPVSINELYEELLEETGDEADRMTTEAVAVLLKTSQSASCSGATWRTHD
jgi:hypothetical protein